jgi:leucyl-tRNA synthetase
MRIFRLLAKADDKTPSAELLRRLHGTIKKVTKDMEGGFKFNTAIAAIMELVNEIYKSDSVNKEILKTLTILISPFVPHMAEEIWQALGAKESILKMFWDT